MASVADLGLETDRKQTLKTPAAEDIRQLVISPQENYMAILTTHTVHIAILPDSSQLTASDTGPLKLKTMTLGPTTHVTSQAAIASALWHPLRDLPGQLRLNPDHPLLQTLVPRHPACHQ